MAAAIIFTKPTIDNLFANMQKSKGLMDFLLLSFFKNLSVQFRVSTNEMLERMLSKQNFPENDMFIALKHSVEGKDLNSLSEIELSEAMDSLNKILSDNLSELISIIINSLDGAYGSSISGKKFKRLLPSMYELEKMMEASLTLDGLDRLMLFVVDITDNDDEELEKDSISIDTENNSDNSHSQESSQEETVNSSKPETKNESSQESSKEEDSKTTEPEKEEKMDKDAFEFDFSNFNFDFVAAATNSSEEFKVLKDKFIIGLEAIKQDLSNVKENAVQKKIVIFIETTINFLKTEISQETLNNWKSSYKNFVSEMDTKKMAGLEKVRDAFDQIIQTLEKLLDEMANPNSSNEEKKGFFASLTGIVARVFKFLMNILLEIFSKFWRFFFVWDVSFATFQKNQKAGVPTFELERVLASW